MIEFTIEIHVNLKLINAKSAHSYPLNFATNDAFAETFKTITTN